MAARSDRQDAENIQALAVQAGKPEVPHSEYGISPKSQPQDFGTSLQLLVRQHLEINANDSPQSTSRVMKSLLDAIHMLQDQVDALGKGLKGDKSQPALELQSRQQRKFIILHRVFCNKAEHCHNKLVYQDQPTYDDNCGWGFDEILKGSIPIFNMGTYLSQRPDVHFVVFKEHTCALSQLGARQDNHQEMPDTGSISGRGERMWIISRLLQGAIREVAQFNPYNTRTLLENAKEMDAPYNFFFHHYQELIKLTETNQTYRETLSPLLSFLDQSYVAEYVEAKNKFSQGLVSALHVEKLFQPNALVVGGHKTNGDVKALATRDERQPLAVVSQSWPVSLSSPNTELDAIHIDRNRGSDAIHELLTWKWIFQSWEYNYDGQFFRNHRVVEIVLQAKSSDEEVNIRKLNVYPLEYAEPDFKAVLERRGRTFWSCRHRRLVSYEDKLGMYGSGERFMIDFHMYQQLHKDSPTFKRSYPNIDDLNCERMDSEMMDANEPPTAPHIYVFPNTILGYNLRSKKWVDLDVDLIQEVTWNKVSFEHLVLDTKTKDLITALVTNEVELERGADIIHGKGNGLIILLHGAPGTGKTFTAESVAELAERPLFQVTCGDMGTSPKEVEEYMNSILRLGRNWNCVVLLDEADTFLEHRTSKDVVRNALVSVFLRVLEYYDGILILTSNRVGSFDEAFKSRIQLALQYSPLTKAHRREIWKNFLSRLEDINESPTSSIANLTEPGSRKRKFAKSSDIDFDDIDRGIDDLAGFQLNGRQIRNVITTARQLATYKGERMMYHHLHHTIAVSNKFDNYLLELHDGLSDDQLARESGIR